MRRLSVSKALISLTLNELLEFEVIRESAKSTRGTQTYVANPNVLNVILSVLHKRERKMLAKAEASYKLLASIGPDRTDRAALHKERVEGMGRMISEAQSVLQCLLEVTALDLKGWLHLNEPSQQDAQKPPQ
jgi:DNA-binding transcriptional regulator GbsR (MarR family)